MNVIIELETPIIAHVNEIIINKLINKENSSTIKKIGTCLNTGVFIGTYTYVSGKGKLKIKFKTKINRK